ncbi:MAG: hypothetical protein ACE5OZ_18235 [Candidatus Heimdallarchaeota archaeon]
MTDQDKFETISRQFEKSVTPKLVIDKVGDIKRIIVALDSSKKAKTCVLLGTKLSQQFKAHTKYLRIQPYGAHLMEYIRTTELAANKDLDEVWENIGPDPEFQAEVHHIAGVPPQTAYELIENALKKSGKSLTLLIKEIEDFKPDFVIIPVPFAETGETEEDIGEDSLGTALDLILRRTTQGIPFLLVEGESVKLWKNILCVFSPEQQAEAVKITLFHALKLADSGTNITLLGIIDPRLAETLADVFSEIEKEAPDLSKAEDGLKLHMEHFLESLQLKIEKKINLKHKVVFGRTSNVLKEVIAETEPGLIVYQSKFMPHDPLDNMADMIARHESQIPVLILRE